MAGVPAGSDSPGHGHDDAYQNALVQKSQAVRIEGGKKTAARRQGDIEIADRAAYEQDQAAGQP
jgi:hypothetical protein